MIKRQQQGFTLVEVAIVLIIIGLILAGVLKGQEMITNARMQNIVNTYDGLTAAILTYQDRYSALPGDDDGADRFADITTELGNGDGDIDNTWTTTTDGQEPRLFWLHLRNAGLISGATDDQEQETNAYGGVVGVEYDIYNMASTAVCFSRVAEEAVQLIDIKYDDGDSTSGDIRASTSATANPSSAYNTADTTDLVFMCWAV